LQASRQEEKMDFCLLWAQMSSSDAIPFCVAQRGAFPPAGFAIPAANFPFFGGM
jgi:hypothetical protein